MATRSLYLVGALPILPALVGLIIVACGGGDATNTGNGGSSSGAAGPVGPATTGSTGGATSSATAGGGAQGGGGASGCTSDDDCKIDPAKPKCDVGTGECVGCLPADDQCVKGQYCDPGTMVCTVGCTDDGDCDPANGLLCNTQTHKCVGCVIDTDCPQGSICISDTCVPGCSGSQPCQAGFTCCGQTCFSLEIDVDHCGNCMTVCDVPPNAAPICVNGQCAMGMCTAPYADCDGKTLTGCEQNTLQDGPCVCTPNDTQPCYQGTPGTENVGPCHGGTQTCNPDGLGWSACTGQVLPSAELCLNGIDEDCDGVLDNGADGDNDGWGICDGDCNDADPLVNPGAFEFIGNMVDDDCDAASSDTTPVPDCSTVQKFTAVTGDDLAKAIDLCQFTTPNPQLPVKKWGVVSATQTLSNGNAASATQLNSFQNFQTAVMNNYGTNVNGTPRKGATMGGLSTGRMRDQGDTGFISGDGPANAMGIPNACPPVYVAAHGGALPDSLGCNANCFSGNSCNDGVALRLQIRVPTNAQSFSYQFKFHSYEYPEWVCQFYNDFYLALLQTTAMGIPADTNVSFDGLGNPFSVNNGFFDVCAASGCYTCPAGASELAGTGMQSGACPEQGTIYGFPAPPNTCGGASKWLTTDAPVVPGETIVLQLMTFDVEDALWDTNVLIDNFHWSIAPAQVGTHE